MSSDIHPRPLRRPPKRPAAPNSKGLVDPVMVPLKMDRAALGRLRVRASYETMRWRLAHGGKGRAVSVQDILRRLVDQLERTQPIPTDAVGTYVRRQR